MAIAYPPERHLLRDLQLDFEHHAGGVSVASLPVVPEICGDDGAVQTGVIGTLVDVIGGGLAASTAAPNWIATADLTLHVTGRATSGRVEAHARVLRAGRTTVVLEVDLPDVGYATMSFSVLPRREINPEVDEARAGPTTMVLPGSRMTQPWRDALGITLVDATHGVVELPVLDWAKNSMGALQGGAVSAVVEAAAEAALRARTGTRLVVDDIQLTYLSFGRVGPLRTRAEVLSDRVVNVELVDTGAESRLMTVARCAARQP